MLKLLLFKDYTGDEVKTKIFGRNLNDLQDRTRRYLTEHRHELIGLSVKDGGTEMVYWRHYEAPCRKDGDGFPEACEEYLDRNVTDQPGPLDYDANLDGDFHFSSEEWSLAVDGSISEEVFSDWEKALDFFIRHLAKNGRIVSATEEEYESYCLEAAMARGNWWGERYREFMETRKKYLEAKAVKY